MSNHPYLKGSEVLDHQTSRCQRVYEDYGQKLSAYMDWYPWTKHQSGMMNREYPKRLQGGLMWRFGTGDTKEKYCQVKISNMGSIVRYSYFVNNTEALAKIQAQFDLRDFL